MPGFGGSGFGVLGCEGSEIDCSGLPDADDRLRGRFHSRPDPPQPAD